MLEHDQAALMLRHKVSELLAYQLLISPLRLVQFEC